MQEMQVLDCWLGMRTVTEGCAKTTKIGETSKLTLMIPPKRERRTHAFAGALQQLAGPTSHQRNFSDTASYFASF
jgi:hypothetical protein